MFSTSAPLLPCRHIEHAMFDSRRHCEFRASIRQVLHPDPAAMRFDEAPREDQPHSCAASATTVGAPAPVESLKNPFGLFGRNARASIRDAEPQLITLGIRLHRDLAPPRPAMNRL